VQQFIKAEFFVEVELAIPCELCVMTFFFSSNVNQNMMLEIVIHVFFLVILMLGSICLQILSITSQNIIREHL